MQSFEEDTSKPIHSDEDRELYTIPIYSSWFLWDEIHETEKTSLKEFFDGSSISRTPKIYKEYRDFIINKYREDSSRKLTFTEVRKHLLGDVNSIYKVFNFLENWGLINYGLTTSEEDEREDHPATYEEGTPSGIRVVAFPNSTQVLKESSIANGHAEVGEINFKLPPLLSYSDVFGEVTEKKGLICASCGDECDAGYYSSTKANGFIICVKCFKSEKYGDNKTAEEFEFTLCIDGRGDNATHLWSDIETLHLLETILKYGDDWNLVVEHVQNKTKLDCISRLIQLPLGDHVLSKTNCIRNECVSNNHARHPRPVNTNLVESQLPPEPCNEQNEHPGETDGIGEKDMLGQNQIVVEDSLHHAPKRKRTSSYSGWDNALLKKVALLSSVSVPHVAACAAKAAVLALDDENPDARRFFEDMEDNNVSGESDSSFFNSPESEQGPELLVAEQEHKQLKVLNNDTVPSALQIRAAIATAFGSAAARAKLIADQEEREIEDLMATILETQVKKLQCKTKHFEELEWIMEKEYSLIQEQKEFILIEQFNVLHQAFTSGITRWKDHNLVKPMTDS